MGTSLKIERIEKPTKEFFEQYIPTARRPFIITGIAKNWKAYSSWTLDYLSNIFGDNEVKVSVSKTKVFGGTLKDGFTKMQKSMKFSEFADLFSLNNKSTDKYYYLQQNSIPNLFPRLEKDIEFPEYVQKKLLNSMNFWIGSGGNITPLHCDRSDNLLAQLKGRKQIVLFAPGQTNFLYPFPAYSKIARLSQIDIDRPDFKKFPKFQKAKFSECVLEPGEMLFIPAFWWHQVYSLDNKELPLISVNFWWKGPVGQWFTPSGRHHIPGLLSQLFYENVRKAREKLKRLKAKLKLKK